MVRFGRYTAVATGNHYSCALRTDAALECWGNDFFVNGKTPPAGTFTAVDAADGLACAVRTDGAIAC